MREILFRGKPIDDKDFLWVNSDGFVYGAPAVPYKTLFYAYYKPYKDDGDYSLVPVEVDPSTVGQFTGLTDKNGKKIFESDIIYANLDGAIGVVCFGKNASPCENPLTCNLGYYVDWQGDDKLFLRNDIGYWVNRSDVEVIGNIHDNRVLLEDKT